MKLVYNRDLIFISILFILIFGFAYSFLPNLITNLTGAFSVYSDILSQCTIIALLFFLIAVHFESNYNISLVKLRVDYQLFSNIVFATFIIFVLITIITSEKIPIIASLEGADAESLAYYREKFLKARQGWQYSFVYINAILAGVIVPYCICVGYERNSKFRHFHLIIFFLYSISFLEKAFFLKIGIPLFLLFLSKSKQKVVTIISGFGIMILVLLLMTIISTDNSVSTTDPGDFFTAYYAAQSPIEKIFWRSLVIPVVTALDAIRLFELDFNGEFLYGATNSSLSFLFGLERVEFEKQVFGSQFGQNEVGTGSANSTFLTEAYINFGFIGVILFSFIAGKIIKVFISSKEISMKGISILFIYGIFNSSLLSTLLSNGFLILLLINQFIVWDNNE
jgi:oligosaccharide repeat unit polymerase